VVVVPDFINSKNMDDSNSKVKQLYIYMSHTRYPKPTNAKRHKKRGAWKNGGNNGNLIFCTKSYGGYCAYFPKALLRLSPSDVMTRLWVFLYK